MIYSYHKLSVRRISTRLAFFGTKAKENGLKMVIKCLAQLLYIRQ